MTCGCRVYEGKKLPPIVKLTMRGTVIAWFLFGLYFLWPNISHWLFYDILGCNAKDAFISAIANSVSDYGTILLLVFLILYVMNLIRKIVFFDSCR